MQLTHREYNILQIALDSKDYIYSYKADVLENIMSQDEFDCNYDLVMALYQMIEENGKDLAYFKSKLIEILDNGCEELATGVLDLNWGRELTLISRILYELERVNYIPTKKLPPLPKFAEEF